MVEVPVVSWKSTLYMIDASRSSLKMKVGQIRLAQQKSIIPQKAADLLIDGHAQLLQVEDVPMFTFSVFHICEYLSREKARADENSC